MDLHIQSEGWICINVTLDFEYLIGAFLFLLECVFLQSRELYMYINSSKLSLAG